MHISFRLWNWWTFIYLTSVRLTFNLYSIIILLHLRLSDLLLYCSQLCFSSDFDNFFHSFRNAFWVFQHDSQLLWPSIYWGKCMTHVLTVEVSLIAQNLRFGASFEVCFNFTLKVSTMRGQVVSCNFLPGKSWWQSKNSFSSSRCCHALGWSKKEG